MSVERNKPPEEIGCPFWMLTFGDAMSLLVTFFVLLISFAELEEAKLLELMGALKGGFRVSPSLNQTLGTSTSSRKLEKTVGQNQQQKMVQAGQASSLAAYEMIMQKRFSRNIVGDYDKGLIVRLLDMGLSFIVSADGVFEPGTAVMYPKKDEFLGVVGDLAADLENEIRVIGVVPDNIALKTDAVKTPWGLAMERALVVKDAFRNKTGLPDDRFSLGVRVEGTQDQAGPLDERFPPDRMEIVVVGFRDLARLAPQDVIIKDRWK